jgi:hypothetical protein
MVNGYGKIPELSSAIQQQVLPKYLEYEDYLEGDGKYSQNK